MTPWEYELGDRVGMVMSAEGGRVIGRSEFLTSSNQYLVRYRAGDGRQVECWWSADALGSLEEASDA